MMNLTLQRGQPYPALTGLSDDAIDEMDHAAQQCKLTLLGVTAMYAKHGEMHFRFASVSERDIAALATGWRLDAGKTLACATVPREGYAAIVARDKSYQDFELVT
jgi:hypothetical protein